ncbi:MAG: hypothetical protein COV66_03785 [Nitrospinae bacterium CG11_big_fil_rev_8_21_14_0_20_45_15]|nr:MAG: hypothetical protein COV66_03785 [Nitrospinae bacterium CG11_big_fil_rev_8_21_14_0_20_45_15]
MRSPSKMSYFAEELSGMKILIVDDVPENLDILSYILKKNFDLSVVSSGEKALQVLDKFEADLILLDVMMPGIDGYETCKRLKANEKTKDIPVIFLTGKIDEESIVKGYRVGCSDYIAKPFKDVEIFSRIGAHLNIQKLIRDLNTSNKKLLAQTEEIIESRNQYQFMVETVSDGVFYLDEHGKVSSINSKLCGELGFKEDELIGKTIEELVDIEAHPELRSCINTRRFGDRATRGLVARFFVKTKADDKAVDSKTRPLTIDCFGIWNLQNNVVSKIHMEKKFKGTFCIVRFPRI